MRSERIDLKAGRALIVRVRHLVLAKLEQKSAVTSAGERGEMETERDCCKRICRRKLHLTVCDWEQCLVLGH